MSRLFLVFAHPEHGEERVALAGDRSWRIGASPDNDIVIAHNDVSRHHAILRVRQGTAHITDLNSKNGTFVNGRRTASAMVRVGDVIHLSSTRLVIEDHDSADESAAPSGEAAGDSRPGPDLDETQGFSGRASAEDMVSLLVTTAAAVRRGAIGEPLSWGVERLGLEALVVLYRDGDGNVSMVSSAGDLGPLIRSSEVLAKIAREHAGKQSGTRIAEINELGETLLVAPMQRDHLLIARFEGAPPAVADMRAVIAAVEAVLGSGNPPCPAGSAPGDRRDPELRRFGSPLHRIAGLSEIINECKRRAAEFAIGGRPVLLVGEPGTGKSLFARVIHDVSRRSAGPFVIAAPAGPGQPEIRLFESDGGPGDLIRRSRGGTMLISDLSLVPPTDQARLLTELWPAGPLSQPAPDQARVIFAISGSIEDGHARGVLDRDLVASLHALWLELPPLRYHAEDIPLLVTHFQREVGGRRGGAGSGFTVAALEALAWYRWPGNVGELRAEVLRLMTRAASDLVVEVGDLAPHIREGLAAVDAPPPDLGALAARPLADARNEFERWRIQRALVDADWNQSLAAQQLGLSRAGLFKKMRKLGLVSGDGGRR